VCPRSSASVIRSSAGCSQNLRPIVATFPAISKRSAPSSRNRWRRDPLRPSLPHALGLRSAPDRDSRGSTPASSSLSPPMLLCALVLAQAVDFERQTAPVLLGPPRSTVRTRKGEAECALSFQKGELECALSARPCPPFDPTGGGLQGGAGNPAPGLEVEKSASEPTFSGGNLAWTPGFSEREATSGLLEARLLPVAKGGKLAAAVWCPCLSVSAAVHPSPARGPPEMGSTGQG
jgi:hypothetical protein